MDARKEELLSKLKTEYITGGKSIRELARETGLSRHAVGNRCKAESWVRLRAEYRARVEKAVIDRVLKEDVKAQADKLVALKDAADALGTIIGQQLAFLSENPSYTRVLPAQEARAFSAALKDLTAVTRNLYDLPTATEKDSMQIAKDRLALEQRRVSAEEGMNASVTVVFEGDTDKWAE